MARRRSALNQWAGPGATPAGGTLRAAAIPIYDGEAFHEWANNNMQLTAPRAAADAEFGGQLERVSKTGGTR
jgi:hypothetical protein